MKPTINLAVSSIKSQMQEVLLKLKKSWQLYVIIAIPVLLILIFRYGPMYGLQIAFKDFVPTKGIMGSQWVGLKHFKAFVTSYHLED